jgi:predicted NBD/HSP70 family sugar kinase
MCSYVLGIDLGGTKISAKLMSQDGLELDFKSIPTEPDFLLQLHTLHAEYNNRWGRISVVSLGVPGPVSEGVMGVSFPLNTKVPTNFDDCFPGVDELIVLNDQYMAT